MSSTNKTTNYELSQYIGSDKPTYLGDYNSDMLKIDTGLHTVQAKADEIGTLSNLTTDSKTNLVSAINEIDSHTDTNSSNINGNTTHIGNLTNLDTTVKTDLVNAINEVKANIDNFNLTSYSNLSSITPTNLTINDNQLKIAKNSDGSLAKIYGYVSTTSVADGNSQLVIHNSGLAPDSDITINCSIILRITGSNYLNVSSSDITIKTNGDIETDIRYYGGNVGVLFIFLPCLYFIKDFGDVPITPQ